MGGFWVLLAKRADPLAELLLFGMMALVACLCWVTLRGGMDRRRFILAEPAGLAFGRTGCEAQKVAWDEIQELRHMWLSPDPHLVLVGGSGQTHRIYYSLDHAAELVAIIAKHAERTSNRYVLPLSLNRPGLLRALALPLACAGPALAAAVFPMLKGAWMPALILGGIGGFIVWVAWWVHLRQPLAISVSERTGIVWKESNQARSIDWDQLRTPRLEMADRGIRRPVVVVESSESRLIIDLGWVDPVRFYALIIHYLGGSREGAGRSTRHSWCDSGGGG